MLANFRAAGCSTAYLDGSFVTSKERPRDYDGCWDIRGVDENLVDPVLLDLSDGRAAQKAKYGGAFFPAQLPEGLTGRLFLDFFQSDPDTGNAKGVVKLDLRRLK